MCIQRKGHLALKAGKVDVLGIDRSTSSGSSAKVAGSIRICDSRDCRSLSTEEQQELKTSSPENCIGGEWPDSF